MEKKNIIFSLLITTISFFSLTAQTGMSGINVAIPKATLHIESKNNSTPEIGAGILIPRVNVFPTTPPNAFQNGMLVFRSQVSSNSFEGFYYWDHPNLNWEYIVTEKITELDLNKSLAYGTSFQTNIVSGNTNYVKVPFQIIDSPKASYFIDANGDLNIGQSGSYYLSFTGGVNKPSTGENAAEEITTAVFVNGVLNNTLISNSVFPSVLSNNRSVTFAVSRIVILQTGDKVSLRTSRASSTQLGTLTVDSPFTLILSYLN